MGREDQVHWTQSEMNFLRNALKNHPRHPKSLTPKLFQELKDTEDIQYLLNKGRGEGQIIAKSKMMRTKVLKAARERNQPPVEKPKATRKESSNCGQPGQSGINAHKGTTWTRQEEEALKTIHGDVTSDNHAWKVETIKKWLEWGTTTDELRDIYSQLKEGRLNEKRTHRDDSAMVSKWNRMKLAKRRKAEMKKKIRKMLKKMMMRTRTMKMQMSNKKLKIM